jgi:Phage integrase SAM-like domain
MVRPMSKGSNPLPGTVTVIRGFPSTLKLYRCAESRFWQVTCYMDGRYIQKTTKAAEKSPAIKFAKEFYNGLLLKKAQNQSVAESHTFAIVAADLLKEDQGRVDRGERKQSLVDDAKYIYEADVQTFFYRHHVKDISYRRLVDYVAYLKKSREESRRPVVSSKTIKNHFILISKILKQAFKLGYIDKIPVFPTVTVQDNPREWFTPDQYELLIKVANEEIGRNVKVRFVPLTVHLRYLIEFMVGSFLRPPDIKTLKHNQITVGRTPKAEYLRIMAYSKVKPAPVISMPVARVVYKKLEGKPDQYVFFPEFSNRDYAMQVMNRQFNHVLKAAGLKEGPNGSQRTLYSLRHTAIMNTLLRAKNVNLLTLARNCRTSVEMLERFYASQLTAEMNVHQLHEVDDPPEVSTIFDALCAEVNKQS